MGSVATESFRGHGIDGSGWLDGSTELSGVKGDTDPKSGGALVTGVFGRSSGLWLNGSSSCEPEFEATTKAGGGCPKVLRTLSTLSTTILGTGVLSKSLSPLSAIPTLC